jgi:hypothetical protein
MISYPRISSICLCSVCIALAAAGPVPRMRIDATEEACADVPSVVVCAPLDMSTHDDGHDEPSSAEPPIKALTSTSSTSSAATSIPFIQSVDSNDIAIRNRREAIWRNFLISVDAANMSANNVALRST